MVLLVVVSMFISSKLIQNEIEERFENTSVESVNLLWHTILENQMDTMVSNSSVLARDRESRNALRSGDIATLKESIKTTYNLLSTGKIISGLEIGDASGNIVVAVPDMGSVNKQHDLIKAALKDGKIKRGVMELANGTPVIVVAFPLLIRGKPVGGAAYYLTFEQAMHKLKESNHSEVVILDKNDQIMFATEEPLYQNMKISLEESDKQYMKIIPFESFVYSTTIQPVRTHTNKIAARLLTIKDFTESYHRQTNITWMSVAATSVIIIVMILGILWYINRSFMKLHMMIKIIKEIATGDLTQSMGKQQADKKNSKDETEQLGIAMEAMVCNLSHMVTEINSTAGQLSSSAELLSAVTRETNVGMDRQLSETEQVATAINELSATAHEVARNASDVANAADDANKEARQGSEVAKKLMNAINEQVTEVGIVDESLKRLQEQALQISEVVTVINSIAEQTNLLALNAAIEAARAGEHGRGFAVVADEVRTLATRTQASTTEINDTITQLQNETETTVVAMSHALDKAKETEGFVMQSNERLDSIAAAVNTINTMITQIATATEEQTSVVEEININVTTIKSISEQVAQGANEANSATGEISDLAHQLENVISKFKIN